MNSLFHFLLNSSSRDCCWLWSAIIPYLAKVSARPEVMDRAVSGPGRFGKLLYVPLPSSDERGLILKALSRNKPIDGSVDLIAVGRDEACENLSGADLSALVSILFSFTCLYILFLDLEPLSHMHPLTHTEGDREKIVQSLA